MSSLTFGERDPVRHGNAENSVYASNISGSLSPKVKELIYIAFDSAATHLYVKGWKLHIRNAIHHGATKEEILEVMEISSALGFQSATTAFPILADELDRRSRRSASSPDAIGGSHS